MTATCAGQHLRSPRRTWCDCGNVAAFWTPPAGTCQTCRKPASIYDPAGDGTPARGWCVPCRDEATTA